MKRKTGIEMIQFSSFASYFQYTLSRFCYMQCILVDWALIRN